MRSLRISTTMVLGTALLTGCLVSDTQVFEYDVIRNGNFGQPLDTTAGFDSALIELNRIAAFEESQGDIKLVDRVGFEATIATAGAASTVSLYFSESPDLTDPAQEATPLAMDLPVPTNGRILTYEESEALLVNFGPLQAAIENGEFTLYVVSGTGGVQFTALNMVVTITVGL